MRLTTVFALLAAAVILSILIFSLLRHRLSRRRQLREFAARAAEDRAFEDRLATGVAMMGDPSAIVKIAGIKQVALIADGWANGRQRCVDLLCHYLAFPVDASDDAEQHVRQVLLTEIRGRLRDEGSGWHGLHFDFSRGRLRNLELDNVYWIGSTVSFNSAEISNFAMRSAVFEDSQVNFTGAELSEGVLCLRSAQVLSGALVFSGIKVFDGSKIDFSQSEITGGQLALDSVEVLGGIIDLSDVHVVGSAPRYTKRGGLSGASIDFSHCLLRAGQVDLSRCHLRRDWPELEEPRPRGGRHQLVAPNLTEAATAAPIGQRIRDSRELISFYSARLERDGLITFDSGHLLNGRVNFVSASLKGGQIRFVGTRMEGVLVDFTFFRMHFGRLIFQKTHISDGYEADPKWEEEIERLESANEVALANRLFASIAVPNGSLRFWDAEFKGGTVVLDEVILDRATVHLVGCRFSGVNIKVANTEATRSLVTTWLSSHEGPNPVDLSKVKGYLLHIGETAYGRETVHFKFSEDTKSFLVSGLD